MAKILVQLVGKSFTTSDLEWFRQAIDGASGHSSEEWSLLIRNDQLTVVVDTEEK